MSGHALTVSLLAMVLSAARLRADDVRAPAREAAVAAFEEGKRLLAAGKDGRPEFQRALECFREATDEFITAPGTCQNLGNAAFLAGDVPYAVITFRAGLILDPHHPLLRANLAYARAQVVYPPGTRGRPPADYWPSWLPRWHTGALLGIGLAAYAVAWIAATGWWLRRRPWLAVVAVGGLGLAAVAGYGWRLHAEQLQMDCDFPPIVIIPDQTPLLTGNGPSYPRHPDLPILRRGMEARRLAERGDWLQIQFASGETGWIPATDAWIIMTPES